ncbi:MAG: hypothetical protein ACKO6L_02770 [Flavobacteriales bacterium]
MYTARILSFMLILVMSFKPMLHAQPPGHDGEPDPKRKEKIEMLKRTFISEKLALTVQEAEKFWPLYNEHDASRDKIRKELHQARKSIKKDGASEKETIAHIELVTQKRKEEIDLEAAFLKACMPILGPDKVMKLTVVEHEFHRELVERMKEKKKKKD